MSETEEDGGSSTAVRRVRKRRKATAPPLPLQEELQASAGDEASAVAAAALELSTELDEEPASKTAGTKVNMDELGADIAKYKRREAAAGPKDSSLDAGATLKAIFSWILTADFFIVVGFLGWLVVAVIARSVLKDGSLLDGFSAAWAPIIQPALGVLMAGTIASGTVSQLTGGGGGEGDEQ
ncbi:hypothetical protein JKP88DRAFT_286260 [Tribonema minus]|uniref:Uncharacterized protein n=1 Tax=Tribonema minus TaxID=303371 RepID=A0A835ZDF1_9STRA|nr:hypothetical protein JKP88DRAFT_286260 [Tribonema minus]